MIKQVSKMRNQMLIIMEREGEAASVWQNWVKINNQEFQLFLRINFKAPPPPDPVEGTWKLIQCNNYEKYLEKIGTGPLSLSMVMRANVVLTITQVQGLCITYIVDDCTQTIMSLGIGQALENCV